MINSADDVDLAQLVTETDGLEFLENSVGRHELGLREPLGAQRASQRRITAS